MENDSLKLSPIARFARWRLNQSTPGYKKMISVIFLIVAMAYFFGGDWKLGVLMLSVSFMFFIELGYAELVQAADKAET